MSTGTAVRDALDRAASERTTFLTMPEFVNHMGGSRAAAAALGVSQRSVQRYVAAETGSARQTRRPSKAVAPRLVELREKVSRRETARQFRQNGLHVAHITADVKDPSDRSRRRDKSALDIDADEDNEDALDALAAAYAGGDDEAIGAAFERAFFGAWGRGRMPAGSGGFALEDVEELDLFIPE